MLVVLSISVYFDCPACCLQSPSAGLGGSAKGVSGVEGTLKASGLTKRGFSTNKRTPDDPDKPIEGNRNFLNEVIR